MNSVSAQQILKETNERIYQRNLPSNDLQAYLSPRPIGLKQSNFFVLPPPNSTNVPFMVEAVFQPCQNFNPGSSGVWSGYATNVTTESWLRTPSVPSSQSDLYRIAWESGHQETQMGLGLGKHIGLFSGVHELPNLPRPPISGSLFHHSTRHSIQPDPVGSISGF
jgi:hypothetical protein